MPISHETPYYDEPIACNKCEQCMSIKIEVDALWLRNKIFDVKRVILTDYD